MRCAVFLSLIATWFCAPSYAVWVANKNAQSSLATLTAVNDDLKAQIAKLSQDIAAFKNSKGYRERVVRDELGYLKAGEIALILPD